MTEEFLHYVWRYQLWDTPHLRTVDGQNLSVVSPGTQNSDAGPDFFNAKVRIGSTLWAGNVEIHLSGSDWEKHGHGDDSAYDNVVLHMVFRHDRQAVNRSGRPLPTLVAEGQLDSKVYKRYEDLQKNLWAPCSGRINRVDKLVVNNWLERLLVERLERKSAYIAKLLAHTNNDWAEAFYIALAGNFGFSVNALPFELLAKGLKQNILARHRNNLMQVESLLFGNAGMLEREFKDAYPRMLQREYHILKEKYSLKPGEKHLWKYLRLRPGNFPTIRIAQFAALISSSESLFSRVLDTGDVKKLHTFFRVCASEYWSSHYTFDKPSPPRMKKLGDFAISTLLINTVLPVKFLYGRSTGDEGCCERAVDMIAQLPPENNTVIRKWQDFGITAGTALQSQALLELRKNYCVEKKCLNCAIGLKILEQ
ncbi:MAG: DUF2851 family protein [Flavobacteriales bacterium]